MSFIGDAWDSLYSSSMHAQQQISDWWSGDNESESKPKPAAIPMTRLHEDGKQDYAYDPMLTATQLAHDEANPNRIDDILRRGYDDEYHNQKGRNPYDSGTDAQFDAYLSGRNEWIDGQKELELKRREHDYANSAEGKAAKAAEEQNRRAAQQEEYDDIRRRLGLPPRR